MKKRWKVIECNLVDLNTPAKYKWDNKHIITITRDEYNNWLEAKLDFGEFVPLPQDFMMIEKVAKILGVYETPS